MMLNCKLMCQIYNQSQFYQNLRMNQGPAVTARDFMKQSCAFKFFTWATILSLIAVVVLGGFVLPNVTCYTNYTCSSYYYTYYVQCYNNMGTPYCCKPNYSTCGNSYDCTNYPSNYHTPCWGILISLWVISGLAFIFICVLLIMWCNFRSRARNPVFNPQANSANYFIAPQPYQPYQPQYNQAPVYNQPPIYYPQQPQYNRQQQYYPPQPYSLNPEREQRNHVRVEAYQPSVTEE